MTIEEAQRLLAQSVTQRSKWREEAREDFAYVAGHQWKEEDIRVLDDNMRPHVVFNTIAPICAAIVGHEISNRQEVSYLPRQVGSAGKDEVLTAAAEWVRQECDAEQEESDAFEDAAICGEGWTDTEIDYDQDLDGKICITRVDPLEMDRDPNSVQKNYADSKWVCRSKVYDISEAQKIWPEADASDFAAPDNKREPSDPVDVIAAAFYVLDSGKDGRKGATANKCVVHDFQWYELEPVYRVKLTDALQRLGPEKAFVLMQAQGDDGNPLIAKQHLTPDPNGLITLDADEYKAVGDLLEAAGIQCIKQKKRCYYRMYFTGDTKLEKKETPTKESFTYKAMTAKRDKKKKYWYGVVRPMKDPQHWANKFMSSQLEQLSSSAKGGIMYEPGFFLDQSQAEEDWADPTKNVPVTEGAIAGQKHAPRPVNNMPPQYFQLMQYANQAINSVAGVNPEVMGLSQALDPTGVMEEGRRQSGLNMLAYLFDALRRYRKEQGRLLLKMITTYIPQGRLIRIVGQDGAQYVPLVYDPSVADYDVIVDEAPTSANVKQRTWEAFTLLAGQLPQLITPQVALIALDYSPMPAAMVEKMKKQAQQAAQQGPPPIPPQEQAKMQVDQANAQLKQAQAQHLQTQGQTETTIAAMNLQSQQTKATAEVEKAHVDAATAYIGAEAQAAAARAKTVSDSMQHLTDGLKIAQQARQGHHDTIQAGLKTIQEVHKTVQAAHKTRQTLTMPNKPEKRK